MRLTRLLPLCGLLAFAGFATPALAGCDPASDDCWVRAHRVIYHMENRIAYLEANPDADDSVKGPIINHLRHQIVRVRADYGARWPHWPTPCCYSRRPIYIR
jgi:hypothetical protein